LYAYFLNQRFLVVFSQPYSIFSFRTKIPRCALCFWCRLPDVNFQNSNSAECRSSAQITAQLLSAAADSRHFPFCLFSNLQQ
jgi:hypothetical protein